MRAIGFSPSRTNVFSNSSHSSTSPASFGDYLKRLETSINQSIRQERFDDAERLFRQATQFISEHRQLSSSQKCVVVSLLSSVSQNYAECAEWKKAEGVLNLAMRLVGRDSKLTEATTILQGSMKQKAAIKQLQLDRQIERHREKWAIVRMNGLGGPIAGEECPKPDHYSGDPG